MRYGYQAVRGGVRFSVVACLMALVLAPVAVFAGPPSAMNIRGQLLDADGHGMPGARDYSVQFYDAASGGNALGAPISGVAEVSLEGLFNLEVIPPPQALLAPQAWYEVAISSSPVPGPLGAGDVFPDRVKMQSVPFALESSNAAHVEVSAIGAGTILDAEFGFLSGLTANIQDQLDAKANVADMYTRTEVDDSKVAKAGDTMTGPLEMTPAAAPGAVTDKLYNVGGALQWNGNPAYRFPWTVVTADTQMAGNNGYVANSAGLSTLTLPTSASLNVGDTVRVSAMGAGGWKIAQNAGQIISTGSLMIPDYLPVWKARDNARGWCSVASSADGTKLVACENIDEMWIYTSADSGATWTARSISQPWVDVASSADGTKLVACAWPGQIYTSTDSGAVWTAHDSLRNWHGVASSADGTKLVACVYGGQIYTSTNSGATWTARDSVRNWYSVASSANGTKLVACVYGGQIYTSTDSGATWTARDSARNWHSVASSADGTKLLASVSGGQLYTSTDSGAAWTARASTRPWEGVTSSADGTKLAATAYGDTMICTSTDSGAAWTVSVSGQYWLDVASSADGTKLVAASYGYHIYTYSPWIQSTTIGTAGCITGGQNTAVELQYIGNDTFVPISHEGSLSAN